MLLRYRTPSRPAFSRPFIGIEGISIGDADDRLGGWRFDDAGLILRNHQVLLQRPDPRLRLCNRQADWSCDCRS
jgi:hypothetical protein